MFAAVEYGFWRVNVRAFSSGGQGFQDLQRRNEIFPEPRGNVLIPRNAEASLGVLG
jgi:hypothetical protein